MLSPLGFLFLGENKDKAQYYGWDNEYGDIKYEIDSFLASQCLVSNREFYEFVEDGTVKIRILPPLAYNPPRI